MVLGSIALFPYQREVPKLVCGEADSPPPMKPRDREENGARR